MNPFSDSEIHEMILIEGIINNEYARFLKIYFLQHKFYFWFITILSFATSFFLSCRTPVSVPYYAPPGTVREVYKRNPDIRITVYPHKFSDPLGSVIFIHGGGWQIGGSDLSFYSDWEELLFSAKLRAFSIEHRTAPAYRGNDIISDCMDAVRYINENAARFGIPENRFAIIGFSSGGHLALMTALRLNRDADEKIKISTVVAYYATTDLKTIYSEGNAKRKQTVREFLPASSGGSAGDFEKYLEKFSPYYNLHENMPYVYLIHGKRDQIIPFRQSVILYDKIRSLWPSRVRLMSIERADHNFNFVRNRNSRRAEKKSVRYILKMLKV